MTDSDFNFDNNSSSPVASLNSPVVHHVRERRTKSHHDCSTSGRTSEEPAMRASPLTAITALGSALGVPVYGQYGTMVGLASAPL